MSVETLITLLGGDQVGTVERDQRGRLRFHYREEWRSLGDAYPLSLSMPLAASEHGNGPIEAGSRRP